MDNLIGKKIVGYRYGEAPESGYSWNYATNSREPGVSMASVGYLPEVRSFAVLDLRCDGVKRHYYIGEIAGRGGDDEFCLTNVRRISYKEYIRLRREQKEVHNEIANYVCDVKRRWLDRGYDICMTYQEVEELRKKLIKK